MKTNLSNLMSIVSEEERKFSNYGWGLRTYERIQNTDFEISKLNSLEFDVDL